MFTACRLCCVLLLRSPTCAIAICLAKLRAVVIGSRCGAAGNLQQRRTSVPRVLRIFSLTPLLIIATAVDDRESGEPYGDFRQNLRDLPGG